MQSWGETRSSEGWIITNPLLLCPESVVLNINLQNSFPLYVSIF